MDNSIHHKRKTQESLHSHGDMQTTLAAVLTLILTFDLLTYAVYISTDKSQQRYRPWQDSHKLKPFSF